MRTDTTLLLVALAVTVCGGSNPHREARRVWNFPDRGRPTTGTTIRRTPATMRTTPITARPGEVPTSTKPTGVIFQIRNCPCRATPQYNPVCGTDGNTYVNRQKLVCARRCGYDVDEVRMGTCDAASK